MPFVKGLSVSVDYWEIEQKSIISSSGSIADDTAALQAATQAALAAGQNINSIDLGSGTGNYKGDGSVVRLAATQADRDFFAAYNARQVPGNQRAAVGSIDILRTTYFNKASQFVNGFDFDVAYTFPKLALGNFIFNTTWTKLNNFHNYSVPGASRTELRNTNAAGGASPNWRGATTLTWRRQQWGAGFGFYYIGSYTDTGATTTQATYQSLGSPSYITPIVNNGAVSYRYTVHDRKSYNIYTSYRIVSRNTYLNKTDIRLGVNNLFNAKPPLSSDSRGYDPAVYNTMARGLTWSAQVAKRF